MQLSRWALPAACLIGATILLAARHDGDRQPQTQPERVAPAASQAIALAAAPSAAEIAHAPGTSSDAPPKNVPRRSASKVNVAVAPPMKPAASQPAGISDTDVQAASGCPDVPAAAANDAKRIVAIPCSMAFVAQLCKAPSADFAERLAAYLGTEVINVFKAQGRYNVLNHASARHWCDIPQQGLPQALAIAMTPKKKHDPLAAEQNREYMLQMIRDPDGTVNAAGYAAAVEVRRRLVDETAARLPGVVASMPTTGKPTAEPSSAMRAQTAQASLPLLAGLPATPAGWTNLSGYTHPVGRFNELLTDNVGTPTTRTLWAGSDGGGIWKSVDGGTTWNPLNDFGGSLSIGRILRSPRNSSEMYVSTNPYGSHTYAPFGIMKSNDGGVTWTQIASTNPATSPDWEYVTHLAIHPTGVGGFDVLLAATQTGAFQSTNSGVTWTRLSAAGTTATHVGFHPLDGNRRAYTLRDGRFVVTTTGDFGNANTYTMVAGADFSYSKFAFASSDINVVYALASSAYAAGNNTNLLRSANGGATWTPLTAPSNFFYNTLFFTGALWVDPFNANHIAVLEASAASTTNATTATAATGWSLANTYWIDHHNVVADPGYNGTTNKIVYTMDDGGLYRYNDVDSLNTGGTYLATGMTVTEVYSAAGRGGNIMLGAQDVSPRVYRTNPPGDLAQRWRFVGYPAACNGCVWIGDGATTAVGRTNGDILYGSRQILDLFVSTDGGLNGVPACGTAPNNLAEGRCAASGNAPFIAPFVIDPNNAATLFAGGDGVWRGTNLTSGAPVWSKIHADLSIYYPTAIAVATTDSNTVWVAYQTGKVFKTANALAVTPTWTEVLGVPPGTKLKIFIDRFNPNIVYLGLAGFTGTKLYATSNGGANWNAVTGLPAASVFAMEQHPKNASWLYVGTAVGLFASIDGGVTWSASNQGPANVHVRDLNWYSEGTISDLLVATFGRGVWRASVQSGSGTSLTVTKAGTTTGRVTSSPAGIYCGTICSNLFDAASTVTLTAVATTGGFTGWSGGCSGTGPCLVTMSAAQSVTATFNPLGSGGPGVIQFAQSTYSVGEGSTAMLSVTRTGGNAGVVSVNYASGGITALPPGDYPPQSSSLTWADGDSAPKTIAIPINIDGITEGNETFTVTLSGATGGATIGSPVFTTVTIIDLETPPGVPTITSAIAGITTATIYFSPFAPAPLFSPLTPSYVVRCIGPDTRIAGGSGSPIVVLGLTTGATYQCDVTASNSYGTGPTSASATVVPSPGAPPGLLNVWSRKKHGGVDYNLDINETQPVSGIVSVEPRIGSSHLIVFRFEANITSVGSVTVTDSVAMPIGSASTSFAGNELQVLLTGIPDNRRVNITVSNVNGGATRSAAMGFLAGDVSGFRSVNAADVAAIKARINQPLSTGNFRFDLNASGTIDGNDVTIAKSHSGQTLAP